MQKCCCIFQPREGIKNSILMGMIDLDILSLLAGTMLEVLKFQNGIDH